jgi:hypothetical protein
MQLAGHKRFEVNLTDERIDLSKARRVEPRPAPGPHGPLAAAGASGTPRRGLPEPASGERG